MIIPTFIGTIALGGAAGVSALVAATVARRSVREADEMRRLIPQWNQLRDVEANVANSKAELQQLEARRIDLMGHVVQAEKLKAMVPGLEQQVAGLEAKKQSLLPMEAEFKRLELLQSQKKLELDQLQQDRIAVQRQLDEAKEAAGRERQAADEQRAAANAAKSEAEIARQQRDALQADAEFLRKKVSEFEQQISTLQSEIARLSAQETGLRTVVAQHERAVEDARERVAEARATQAAVESRIAELIDREEKLRESVASVETELRKLTVELSKLHGERAALLAEIEALQRQIEKLEAQKKAAEGKLGEYATEMSRLRGAAAGGSFTLLEATREVFVPYIETDRVEGSYSSEEAAVVSVAKHAQSLGFLYPDRVIRAFHTSLKLGRQAPLLVLAGISGTGKSQLPRLYCDALGINFLPMAVQPGWDSPADLVGFFSHIEHRFKPTPLARALVQMDSYFEESLDALKKDEFNKFLELREAREDQVLLVLLDEMNLARVEYYFSDFLSRLELRNSAGFEVEKKDQRQRVQLSLEAPGAEGALKQLSVFPGDNVLFVGTMNEDESTMALSDKVIDRANVLRFGKPVRLKSETGGTSNSNPKYLTISDWRDWTKSTESSAADAKRVAQIADWTNKLNEALDAVQRAFAHRTAAAMKAYCLAYPLGKLKPEDGLKIAFADQIEQRVMPKLRGIDPTGAGGQKAFGEVRSLIEELGDNELLTAFNRGLEANEGQSYVWYGTQRRADG